MMENFIDQIKRNNRDLSVPEIRGLLYLISDEENLTNNKLISLTGIPKETLRHFKKSIAKILYKTTDDSVVLNEGGRKALSAIELYPYKWSLAESMCFHSDEEYKKYENEIKKIKEKYSPEPKREYDQFLATPRTSYMKSKILMEKGLVEGKSIAFLGDDDLNSLCLASMDSSFKEIYVFDIDDEILEKIKKGSEEMGFNNIKTIKYDARKELEGIYEGRFDVVVFDPPYTRNGAALFLEKSIKLLEDIEDFEGKYVLMYFGNSFKSPEKILKIQEIINRFGFSIEDRIEKFSRYSGAQSIGSASSLYILKAHKFTRRLDVDPKNIYTYEKTPEENFPFVDHLVFKIFDVKKDLLVSKSRLMSALEDFCKIHRLKVVEKVVTEFKGGGMTVSFVLANSNLTAHTWPEHGSLHIDLVTCSPIYNKDLILTTIRDVFGSEKVNLLFVE
jgi:predicted methyltransferase